MKKEETIERYGEGKYNLQLEQKRVYYKEHPEEKKAATKKYQEEHPEKEIAKAQERYRKGGKHYAKHLEANRTGLQGERNRIRGKHRGQYKQYKAIIAPESQIHHEWIPKTSDYRGVALVEANAHQYGIICVIQILDGKITLRTEEEVKVGGNDFEN